MACRLTASICGPGGLILRAAHEIVRFSFSIVAAYRKMIFCGGLSSFLG